MREKNMKLKVMSFNTQHCFHFLTRKIDFDAFAEEIKKHDPDIVGLNEMRGEGPHREYEDQVKILAQKLGYYYYFAKAIDVNGENPYGNGILSRYPIYSAQIVKIPDPKEKTGTEWYETRCLLKTKIFVSEGIDVDVCVTHFGLNPDEQSLAVETVLNTISATRCILMGDFNITPDNDLLAPIKERMQDTADWFQTDLKSWPVDEPTVKIDYIFMSKDMKVTEADIPADIVSDHRPYIAQAEV